MDIAIFLNRKAEVEKCTFRILKNSTLNSHRDLNMNLNGSHLKILLKMVQQDFYVSSYYKTGPIQSYRNLSSTIEIKSLIRIL